MSLISRFYDFVNGTPARSGEVDAELNQLVAAHNEHEITIQALDGSGGAAMTAHKGSADHDGRYYTEAEVDALLSAIRGVGYVDGTLVSLKALSVGLQSQLDTIVATYSTDAERIAAFQDVVNQFQAADSDIINLITSKANVADVYTKAQTDAKTWDTANLLDRVITSIKLGLLSVGSEHLKDGAVTASKLQPDLLENIVVAQHRGLPVLDHPDGSVTLAKLASDVQLAITNATIMTDRTTAQKYRFYMDNGNLFVEEVV